MPELPEAETMATRIRERLCGAAITDLTIRRDDIVREGLVTAPWYVGARLTEVRRLGKSVALTLKKTDQTRFVVFELGMTGLLFFTPLTEAYRKHTHVTLSLTGPTPALHYWNPRRFGRVYLLDHASLKRFAGRRFGYDALTMSWEEFRAVIGSHYGRLKPLLLRQQVIAGIGNIYANEILYRARLHPYREVGTLRTPKIRTLYDTMREVLQQAIEDGGSSIRDFLGPDGTKGQNRKRHLIYNKSGQPCGRCGKTIRKLRGERSSFVCPGCQRR
jgi:formamidopyrimidine-DNA glycosylase